MSNLDAIVEEHSKAVWRTVYRLLNHYDDARDCYQETFLAALRLVSTGQVRNWRATLVAIATRRAVDRMRVRYRERIAKEAWRPPVDRAAGCSPEIDVAWEELRDKVRQALATLPGQQAEAFWLRHLEGLSTAEVAEQMDVEPGHVRVLAHRAAVGIREILGPAYGPVPLSEEPS